MTRDDDESGKLPVHTRRVVDGDGGCVSENEVYCYHRGQSLPVAVCEGCSDYVGTEVDVERHQSHVVCRRMTLATARGLAASRRTLLRRRPVEPTRGEHDTIGEVMTRDVLCAREELSLAALATLLAERGLSALPVVDAH